MITRFLTSLPLLSTSLGVTAQSPAVEQHWFNEIDKTMTVSTTSQSNRIKQMRQMATSRLPPPQALPI